MASNKLHIRLLVLAASLTFLGAGCGGNGSDPTSDLGVVGVGGQGSGRLGPHRGGGGRQPRRPPQKSYSSLVMMTSAAPKAGSPPMWS